MLVFGNSGKYKSRVILVSLFFGGGMGMFSFFIFSSDFLVLFEFFIKLFNLDFRVYC